MSSLIKRLLRLGLLCVMLSVLTSAAVEKQGDEEAVTRSAVGQAYYDQIQSVLSEDAFGEKKKVKKWRLKQEVKDEDKENAFIKWLRKLLNGVDSDRKHRKSSSVTIAQGIEVLLWALVIGLIIFLLVRYRKQLQALISGMADTQEVELPSTMFGLDVKKTSMPKDVISSAQTSWHAGEPRQAVALLLQASLIKLLHEHGCVFQDSDTEAECCVQIKNQAPKITSQYMHLLVQVWQQIAYGHRVPTQKVFDTLCRQWQEVF